MAYNRFEQKHSQDASRTGKREAGTPSHTKSDNISKWETLDDNEKIVLEKLRPGLENKEESDKSPEQRFIEQNIHASDTLEIHERQAFVQNAKNVDDKILQEIAKLSESIYQKTEDIKEKYDNNYQGRLPSIGNSVKFYNEAVRIFNGSANTGYLEQVKSALDSIDRTVTGIIDYHAQVKAYESPITWS